MSLKSFFGKYLAMTPFREYLGEGDTTLHRALLSLGYKRPTDKKTGEVKPKDRGTYAHRSGVHGKHFEKLAQTMEKLKFKHEPRYDSDLRQINHIWTKGGCRVTAVPQYMTGHAVAVEGA